jgi:hypothetical protein
MIALETEYYREQVDKLVNWALLFTGSVLLCGSLFVIYELLKGLN